MRKIILLPFLFVSCATVTVYKGKPERAGVAYEDKFVSCHAEEFKDFVCLKESDINKLCY